MPVSDERMPALSSAGLTAGLAHPGYAAAAGAALVAVLALWAVTIFHGRKRITWSVDLDTPVGLIPGDTLGPDARTDSTMIFTEDSLRTAGTSPGDAERAWLALVAVTNPGLARIRGRDFRPPLTFTFPGREVYTARVYPASAGASRRRPAARLPTLTAAGGDPAWDGTGDSPQPSIELGGDLVLNRNDAFTLMLVLRGTPADMPPVGQEGELTGGKIIAMPPGSDPRSKLAVAIACAAVLLASLLLGLLLGAGR